MHRMAGPDAQYWKHALELEQADRLDEAEAVIREALKDQPWPARIAHLYELRLARLRTARETDKARDAYDRAVQWIRAYASGATSGGEGAALSYQANQFINGLGDRP
jgi:tetratricopeptide (TPR) repeat protein